MAVFRGGGFEGYHEDPRVGWKDRVEFADPGRGVFAYRPGQVLTTAMGAERARKLAQDAWVAPDQRIGVELLGPCARLTNVRDPLAFIADLRIREDVTAHPNSVLFVHCGCCPPHPAAGVSGGYGFGFNPASINPASINPASINPASINPASINPASINPASINPASINPASINPASINPNDPARRTGLRRSSARPVTLSEAELEALQAKIGAAPKEGAPRVIVLDTGLAMATEQPGLLSKAEGIAAALGADVDEPDNDQNHHLDPAAGHGMFIAGIVNRVAPGCTVTVDRVATMYGDTDEFAAATAIENLLTDTEQPPVDDRTILNLSFGGYVMDDQAMTLAWAIRKFQSAGGVVVASAGNDSTCLRAFPAALPDVVSVGAVGPGGPALFTNYGPWVRACAPGVDLTSLFFRSFEGTGQPGPEGIDPDNFEEWARWSGTSFSAPVVVGALARMMMWSGCSASEAVSRVIDAPELMRIPNLGTVVNAI